MHVKSDTVRWAKVAAALRQARREHGLTLEQAGQVIGRPLNTLAGWETGAAWPDAMTLVRLARMYGIEIEALLDGRLVRRGASKRGEALGG